MDPSLELMRQLEALNGSDAMEIPNLGLMEYLSEDYLSHHYNLYSCSDHLLGSLPAADQCQPRGAPPQRMASVSVAELAQGGRKRKGVEPACHDPSNERSPDAAHLAPLLTSAKMKNKNSPGSGKRARGGNSMEAEKPKEVVHVRARRGQATDSHSLAERSRRGRINERMRCLQDLVPGCYKTMGMAGMLDEIINYVQSLQNQVEFLSLKLSAASSFYGCCFDMDTIATPQGGSEQDVARQLRMEYGACTSFSSTVPHHL